MRDLLLVLLHSYFRFSFVLGMLSFDLLGSACCFLICLFVGIVVCLVCLNCLMFAIAICSYLFASSLFDVSLRVC